MIMTTTKQDDDVDDNRRIIMMTAYTDRFLSLSDSCLLPPPLEENLGPFDCSWGRIMTRCVSSSLFDFLHTFEFPARNHSKGERKKEENRSG